MINFQAAKGIESGTILVRLRLIDYDPARLRPECDNRTRARASKQKIREPTYFTSTSSLTCKTH